MKWSLLSIKWNHLNSSSLTPSSKDSCPLYVELPTLPFLKQLSYEYKHISVAASLILPYQFAYLTNTCTGYVLVKKSHLDNNPKIRATAEESKESTKNAFSNIFILKLCKPSAFLK